MHQKVKNCELKVKSCPKAAGFTLMELVVVTMVIGVLTTTAFANFQRHRAFVHHSDALSQAMGLMKEARSYASTSRGVYDTSQPSGQELYIPPEGYGVYFEQNADPEQSKIILFANTSTAGNDLNQFSVDDIVEKTYLVHQDVVLELMEGVDLGPPEIKTPILRATVIFRPPLAEVTIIGNADPADVPASPAPTLYDTLELSIARRNASDAVEPGFISINKTAGFPDLKL